MEHDKIQNLASELNDSLTQNLELMPLLRKRHLLKWLCNNKFILHGSNNILLNQLNPHKTNCNTHKNGNLKAVYGTNDYILATYYAILDRRKWAGVSKAQKTIQNNKTTYRFALEKSVLDQKPFTKGCIYILDRNDFTPFSDENICNISELYSLKSCVPIGKISVFPYDFEFLNRIEQL